MLDGLTAYYDENAHCVMKTGFPLADLFGASVREFKLVDTLFEVNLVSPEITLPGHCWQGNLLCSSANPIGFDGEDVIAARNQFGRGEVLWIPSLLGLGARLGGNFPLSELLSQELAESISATPFRFTSHHPGMLMRTLSCNDAYVTILINKNKEAVDLEMILPKTIPSDCQPKILFSTHNGKMVRRNKFYIPPEETLVVKWE
jgi:beta-galactosidase